MSSAKAVELVLCHSRVCKFCGLRARGGPFAAAGFCRRAKEDAGCDVEVWVELVKLAGASRRYAHSLRVRNLLFFCGEVEETSLYLVAFRGKHTIEVFGVVIAKHISAKLYGEFSCHFCNSKIFAELDKLRLAV